MDEWAVARVENMASNARINAGRYGVKLLKGHGYPNEVMSDAQDALALEAVLAALRARPAALSDEELSGMAFDYLVSHGTDEIDTQFLVGFARAVLARQQEGK